MIIAAVRELCDVLGIPAELPQLAEDDIPDLVNSALREAHYLYPVPKYLNQRDGEQLLGQLLSR